MEENKINEKITKDDFKKLRKIVLDFLGENENTNKNNTQEKAAFSDEENNFWSKAKKVKNKTAAKTQVLDNAAESLKKILNKTESKEKTNKIILNKEEIIDIGKKNKEIKNGYLTIVSNADKNNISPETNKNLPVKDAIKIEKNKNAQKKLPTNKYKKLFLIGIAALLCAYMAIGILIYLFKIKNENILIICKYIPYPALVSKAGIINYYDYTVYLKLNFKNNDNLDKKIKEDFITLKIAKRYNLDVNNINDINENTKNILNFLILKDAINKNQLKKAAEARTELLSGSPFEEIAAKYGDDFKAGFISYSSATKNFGNKLNYNEANNVSNIIYSDNGYYLIKITEKNRWGYGMQIFFLKAEKKLEDIVLDEEKNLKLINLVE